MYVFRELSVPPGTRHIEVSFVSRDEVGVSVEAEAAARTESAPVDLSIEKTVTLPPGAVLLVTYDEASGGLVTRE